MDGMEEYIGRREHEQFAKRMDEENYRQNKRINALEAAVKQNQELIRSVDRISVNMEQMLKEQIRQGARLEVLEKVPSKNWNTVKTAILSAIGSAIGTALIIGICGFIIQSMGG